MLAAPLAKRISPLTALTEGRSRSGPESSMITTFSRTGPANPEGRLPAAPLAKRISLLTALRKGRARCRLAFSTITTFPSSTPAKT